MKTKQTERPPLLTEKHTRTSAKSSFAPRNPPTAKSLRPTVKVSLVVKGHLLAASVDGRQAFAGAKGNYRKSLDLTLKPCTSLVKSTSEPTNTCTMPSRFSSTPVTNHALELRATVVVTIPDIGPQHQVHRSGFVFQRHKSNPLGRFPSLP